jgi:hypothetical protein
MQAPVTETEAAAAVAGQLHIAIVGLVGGTHVGESLRHAAAAAGHGVAFFDAGGAEIGSRLQRAVAWRTLRRPVSLDQFSAKVVAACARQPPDLLITTGSGALSGRALQTLRRTGVPLANYSTDDPWNPLLKAGWHLRALPHYDVIFTPRRANLEDFRRLGCGDVRYLPFGYDDRHAGSPDKPVAAADGAEVLFVGGADRDRVAFAREFMGHGMPITLVGGYWDRFASVRRHAAGVKSPDELRSMTLAAKINLCLVRRANRDGHVMRSLEIGAIGGCMLAEYTPEHRELFGPDGEAAVYFNSPLEAAERAKALLPDRSERTRLAAALHHRIANGRHSYRDRLETLTGLALPGAAGAGRAAHETARMAT